MLPGVVVFLLRHYVCHFNSLSIHGYLRASFSTRVFHQIVTFQRDFRISRIVLRCNAATELKKTKRKTTAKRK